MKKNELKNGDIIILRNGELGLYLAELEAFIYQESGYDYMETEFDDELANPYEEPDFDVMQVYREPFGNVISFFDYEEGELIFERDEKWERPNKKERETLKAMRIAERKAQATAEKEAATNATKQQFMTVLVQGIYGNRTAMQIKAEDFDATMLGCLAVTHFDPERKPVDRTIIHVPGTEDLVIVYNRYQEADALENLRKFAQSLRKSKSGYNPTAVIPELGIVLYSRCIVCRMSKDGQLESMKEGDREKVVKYLAQ